MKTLAIACAALVLNSVNAAEWTTSQETDRMSGKTSERSVLVSDNTAPLLSPYRATHGTLVFSQSNGQLFGAFIVTSGILECSRSCMLEVRADERPMEQFRAVSMAGRHTMAFFVDADPVAAYLSGAKRVMVRASFYGQGRHIFEFSPASDMPLLPKKQP